MRGTGFWFGVVTVLIWLHPAAGAVDVVDDFEDITPWSAIASDNAQVWIAQEPGRNGMGLRIDFDLGTAGFVIVRKPVALTLPRNFALTFDLLGEGLRNNFEVKLVDPTGKNVWWWRQRDFSWPTKWQEVVVRRSRLELAWGTSSEVKLGKVAYIEFAIAAGEGGSGSVWIDDLVLEERPVPANDSEPPAVVASSARAGEAGRPTLDGPLDWHSEAEPEEQWIALDFGDAREYGGLVVDWDPDDYATAYDVEVGNDGEHWQMLHETERGNGGRDYLYLPDSESRWVRLRLRRSSRGQGYGVRALAVKPIGFSASPNQFFAEIAREERPGLFPKYFLGRQTYWTVVGVDGDGKEGLVNEEGMIEVDRGSFSIEPFLYTGDRLVTWYDVERTQSLEDGYLPMPGVAWKADGVDLRVTAFATGTPGASLLYARYRIENRGAARLAGKLFLAVRPFQVLPPWQSLNMVGGVSPIREIRYEAGVARVNRDKAVVAITPPEGFGGTRFEEGDVTEALARGTVPPRREIDDPTGFASGAFAFAFDLGRGEARDVVIVVPFHEPYVEALATVGPRYARALAAGEQQATKRRWQTLLGRVEIDLPPAGQPLVHTVKSNLAYALINRDGAALQPGSRNYARSWIRDGAATSSAFLEMGFPAEVREFVRWYATQQLPDGRVPCCVDRRGPDTVPEHDSPGQFLWIIGEYYRYTRDVGLVADLWSNVVRAIDYISRLRTRRMTDSYRTPAKAAYFGLLPESISHEGYSSHPVHSYWDDFWTLAGLRAAPTLALAVGDIERAEAFTALRDDFEATLVASIPQAMAMHGIDYVPGSVEFGDYDPSSTAIAITTTGGLEPLRPALERTFDLYYAEVAGRIEGTRDWVGYSPYEIRNVEALVRLGRREQALTLLDWFMADRRPLAWNEWAEVSWRDRNTPAFIGDMPHTWVGSVFIHAVRSLFVYERDEDRALVVGAGVPAAWLRSERGVVVRRLPTPYGVLSYKLRADGPNSVRLLLFGDLIVPPGKILLPSPLPRPIASVTIDGRPAGEPSGDEIVIDRSPADVTVRYREAEAAP